ncbi:hypothetical protein QUB11_15305 [Microcoleus sp. B6-A1]|uniref:hypothetical protein n=1 Tax=Microcoleus sp. B6-A1 TaxID=2818684 RepID=UPI002FD05E2E
MTHSQQSTVNNISKTVRLHAPTTVKGAAEARTRQIGGVVADRETVSAIGNNHFWASQKN